VLVAVGFCITVRRRVVTVLRFNIFIRNDCNKKKEEKKEKITYAYTTKPDNFTHQTSHTQAVTSKL